VIGLELCSMDSDSSRHCPVDSESLWLIIIPKNKDHFMLLPTMKIVHEHTWVRPSIVCGRG
jgi:hypothetical protein